MEESAIKEFLFYVEKDLIDTYKMDQPEAQKAVKESYLTEMLETDNDFVVHDTIEEWSEFVYKEWNNKKKCVWKSEIGDRPIIIDKKDYSDDEYRMICKLFGLKDNSTSKIVLREYYSIEYETKKGA